MTQAHKQRTLSPKVYFKISFVQPFGKPLYQLGKILLGDFIIELVPFRCRYRLKNNGQIEHVKE